MLSSLFLSFLHGSGTSFLHYSCLCSCLFWWSQKEKWGESYRDAWTKYMWSSLVCIPPKVKYEIRYLTCYLDMTRSLGPMKRLSCILVYEVGRPIRMWTWSRLGEYFSKVKPDLQRFVVIGLILFMNASLAMKTSTCSTEMPRIELESISAYDTRCIVPWYLPTSLNMIISSPFGEFMIISYMIFLVIIFPFFVRFLWGTFSIRQRIPPWMICWCIGCF